MKYIADLHIHSKYSRAVSRDMTIVKTWEWAKRKGIDLVSTGDWTHPLWLRERKTDLEEMGNGILQLKSKIPASPAGRQNPKSNNDNGPNFLLSTELSSIYSQG